jgi:hypothetical protein
MALLDIQPEVNPIEYTHFDSWFEYEEGDEEDGHYMDAEDATPQQLSDQANDILDSWEDTLSIKIDREGLDFSTWDAVYDSFGTVAFQVAEAGYDVYVSDEQGFIEVYKEVEPTFIIHKGEAYGI